jgi:two-component system sensor histidine kinase ChiS
MKKRDSFQTTMPSAAMISATSIISYIRPLLVQVMIEALQYWQQCTFRSKIELATESAIWTVNMDNSSPQTRTMDKYLHIDSIPKRPKVEDVVRTAHFVLFHGKRNTGLRESLETDLNELIKLQQQQCFSHFSDEKQLSQN